MTKKENSFNDKRRRHRELMINLLCLLYIIFFIVLCILLLPAMIKYYNLNQESFKSHNIMDEGVSYIYFTASVLTLIVFSLPILSSILEFLRQKKLK